MVDELYPTSLTRVEVWASKNNRTETDKSPPYRGTYIQVKHFSLYTRLNKNRNDV